MTEDQTDAPETEESFSDLFQRLEAQGAKREHLHAILNWQTRHENARAIRLARLYFGKEEGEEISASDFAQRLEDLSARAYGVEAAVASLAEDSPGKIANGVVALVSELARNLDAFSEAFSAETAASRQREAREALRAEMEGRR